jgi:hypothetical protein
MKLFNLRHIINNTTLDPNIDVIHEAYQSFEDGETQRAHTKMIAECVRVENGKLIISDTVVLGGPLTKEMVQRANDEALNRPD